MAQRYLQDAAQPIRGKSQQEAAIILFLCIFIPFSVIVFIYCFYKPIRRCLERVRIKIQMRKWKHHLVDGFSMSDALDMIDEDSDSLGGASGRFGGRSTHSDVEIGLYAQSTGGSQQKQTKYNHISQQQRIDESSSAVSMQPGDSVPPQF